MRTQTDGYHDKQGFLRAWVARNRGNELYLHFAPPHWSEHYQNWLSAEEILPLPEHSFNGLTYQHRPIEVSVVRGASGKIILLPKEQWN